MYVVTHQWHTNLDERTHKAQRTNCLLCGVLALRPGGLGSGAGFCSSASTFLNQLITNMVGVSVVLLLLITVEVVLVHTFLIGQRESWLYLQIHALPTASDDDNGISSIMGPSHLLPS